MSPAAPLAWTKSIPAPVAMSVKVTTGGSAVRVLGTAGTETTGTGGGTASGRLLTHQTPPATAPTAARTTTDHTNA